MIYLKSPGVHVDNFDELFGKMKSKLFGIDFLQTIRDDPVALFEIQELLLKLSKLKVSGPIVDIILDLEPLHKQVYQVVR